MLASVVEHHQIEFAANHLPRLRTLVRLVVPKIERSRQLPRRVHKLHAVLVDEATGPHLRQHVEAFEYPVRLRNQRLTDVKPRELFTLEQLNAIALLSNQRRRRRTGRTTPNHHDIGFNHGHAVSFRRLGTPARPRRDGQECPTSRTTTSYFLPLRADHERPAATHTVVSNPPPTCAQAAAHDIPATAKRSRPTVPCPTW